jgi:CheY-like chemotaxis protein
LNNWMPTIIVLEDERDIRDFLSSALEAEGYRAVPLPHPTRIERALESTPPDVFLMDIMLRGSSGIEVAHRLHAQGYGHIPMVAMSASNLMADYAARSGLFTDTIIKPFDLDDLLAIVERLAPAPSSSSATYCASDGASRPAADP